MESLILKADTLKSLINLKKQFISLPKDSFPCAGTAQTWSLLTELLEKLINRINLYSPRQIKLINTLLPTFDSFCGLLDNAVSEKVPWSILPSLENIFSQIKKGALFVITPQWETNYGIYNRNIIEYLDKNVLSIPNLIFDETNLASDKKDFLQKYNKEIYLLLYPIGERLSVLHFSLLGHEIGHIFATIFVNSFYRKISTDFNLQQKIEDYVKKNIPPDIKGGLFEPQYVTTKSSQVKDLFDRITLEIVSDFVGAIIFGPSALLATFVFSLRYGYDDPNVIKHGYLPWRFRLNLLNRILLKNLVKMFPNHYSGANKWVNQINEITSNFDYKDYISKQQNYRYILHLLELFDHYFDDIYNEIIGLIPKPHYADICDAGHHQEVVNRLDFGIIPNCTIDNDLVEYPIDFRNIIAGTWLCLCEQDLSDSIAFNNFSRKINLLSLKAIELSYLQKALKNDN